MNYECIRFPAKNEEHLLQWLSFAPTGYKITQNSRICTLHFDDEAYYIQGGVFKLKRNSVPTSREGKENIRFRQINETNINDLKVC